MNRCLTLLGCLLFVHSAQAQSTVRGRVLDLATGEALPAATVQIEGTYRGTIASVEGAYVIRVDSLPATLVVRFIGYETLRRTVDAAAGDVQDFHLRATSFELEGITVTGEDPALGIMRRVIERKKVWRAALESFRADAYTRLVISNDTGIVSIVESATVAFWDRDRGMREILKARRKTENIDFDVAMPAAETIVNLYDDDVPVAGHVLLGVTHPEALDLYAFSLEGKRRIDNTDVYDIAVEPRSRLTSGFAGRISILDSAYAMIDAELRPGAAFLFPQPVRRFEVTIRQQFSSFGGEFWLPVDYRSEAHLAIGVPGLIALPPIHVSQVSRLSDYAVNVPVPDSLFEGEAAMRVDSTAVAAAVVSGPVVPLSAVEAAAYAEIDSTMRLEDAFAPTGLLGRLLRIGPSEVDSRGWLPDWLGLEPRLWYNRVDALHGGMGASVRAGEHVKFGAGGGLSSGLRGAERHSYHASVSWRSGGRRDVFLEMQYRAGTAMQYESDRHGRLTNGIAVLLGGTDYFDYYRRRGASLTAGIAFERSDVTVSATLLAEEHASLLKTTDYDLRGKREPMRANPAVRPGPLRAVEGRIRIGDESPLSALTGEKTLEMSVETGVAGDFGIDSRYTVYGVSASWTQRTFAGRRLLPNTLDLRMELGASTGYPPPQRAFIAEAASSSGLGSFGVLRTREGFPYTGEAAAAFFWEHNFRTIPFELLRLRGFVERGLSLIVFGGHALTWPGSGEAFRPPRVHAEGIHHEVGVSLSGLLGILRVDFARRLDAPGFAVGFGAARLF